MGDDLDAVRADLARHAEAAIREELARRGALPPDDEPCELSIELAEVAAELRRRDAERERLAQRVAELEADPAGALFDAIDRLAVALAALVQPRPVTKYIERDADGLIARIVEVAEEG